jgi:hypothetical protein
MTTTHSRMAAMQRSFSAFGLGLVFCLAALAAQPAWAQRAGGQRSGASAPGGHPSPQQSAEEKERALHAKEWESAINQVRANSAPPPMPKIRFPSQNESFLGSLRWAENPKQDLAKYLDKMWKDNKDPAAQRTAVGGLWQDAEKPLWVRPAIEDFYRQRSNGQSLKTAPEPATIAEPAATGVAAKPAPAGGVAATSAADPTTTAGPTAAPPPAKIAPAKP